MKELIRANKELSAELILVNEELILQSTERKKQAAELTIANQELVFENEEKEKRATELVVANIELAFQNLEKEKRGAELIIADKELVYQNKEKEKRSDELVIANKELVHQNNEKEKRAAELAVANIELAFQNQEKEKRAAELVIANSELVYQNNEKEKRAAELLIANRELLFENKEKEKRAAELAVASIELAFQNQEKEKRAAELIIANSELVYQNKEKEKRAAELLIANRELLFENEEKEKRAEELIMANKELQQFAYIASHDLQEPLRTVSNYMQVFQEEYREQLDDNARKYLNSVNNATKRMSLLINSLLDFSRIGTNKKLAYVDIKMLLDDVIADIENKINTSKAIIEVMDMPKLHIYEPELRQVFQNLIVNSIKFQKQGNRPKIQISAEKENEKWRFTVKDNGIGIEPRNFNRVFNMFQRLVTKEKYEGTGIGLANCNKIVHLHKGEIWVQSNLGEGASFHFTIAKLDV